MGHTFFSFSKCGGVVNFGIEDERESRELWISGIVSFINCQVQVWKI